MRSIPFSFPEVYEGLADAEGIARFEGDRLVLEFEVKDSIFGVIKSDVKRVELRVADIESVDYEHRIFRSRLMLRARSLHLIEAIPSRNGGEVELRFKRRYRDEVAEFATSLASAAAKAHREAQ